VNYRKLGACGLRISEIGLGSWITYGGQVADKAAKAVIRRAFDLGVNFFDTADVYENGRAETVVGAALKGLPRKDFVLATKCFFPMAEGPNDRGLSRKHIYESCNASLQRLGVDYVDLYQCHRYDESVPLEETLRALEDLVRWGKTLYVGVSSWSAAQIADAARLAEARGYAPLVSNQPVYNIINHDVEREVMARCAAEGLGLVVYSPLAQGVLTGKYKPGQKPPRGTRASDNEANRFMRSMLNDQLLAKVAKLEPLAKGLGISMAQLALAWCLRRPEVSSVIVGATRPGQIEENVAASGVQLPAEVVAEIEKLFYEKK
jgi:aryl-alcohol dehydrogenase-like predicted oxidoreductase